MSTLTITTDCEEIKCKYSVVTKVLNISTTYDGGCVGAGLEMPLTSFLDHLGVSKGELNELWTSLDEEEEKS